MFFTVIASQSIEEVDYYTEPSFRSYVFSEVYPVNRYVIAFAQLIDQLDGIVPIYAEIIEGLFWRNFALRDPHLPRYERNHLLLD